MQALFDVILPVFLVLGFGYAVRWRKLITDTQVDHLAFFAQQVAIPCLLFMAITRIDLGAEFDLAMLFSFYLGAATCFVVGLMGARLIFGRDWEDCVSIGFVGLFSNTVLLGLPIAERAYGPEALAPNFMIIALHAPFCYILGLTTMEVVRNRTGRLRDTMSKVASGMLHNPIVVAAGLGLAVNLTGLPVPTALAEALDLMARAGLPAALFGLGAVLYRYSPEGDLRITAFICAVSLVLHPLITWIAGKALGVGPDGFRAAVLTAAMAPGVNVFIFASIYGCGKRVAASSVLLGTGAVMVTGWLWLELLAAFGG